MYSVGERLKWKLAGGTAFVQTEQAKAHAGNPMAGQIIYEKTPIKMLEERQNLYPLNEKYSITELSFYKEAARGIRGNSDEGQWSYRGIRPAHINGQAPFLDLIMLVLFIGFPSFAIRCDFFTLNTHFHT